MFDHGGAGPRRLEHVLVPPRPTVSCGCRTPAEHTAKLLFHRGQASHRPPTPSLTPEAAEANTSSRPCRTSEKGVKHGAESRESQTTIDAPPGRARRTRAAGTADPPAPNRYPRRPRAPARNP